MGWDLWMGHAVWQVQATGAETHGLRALLPNNVPISLIVPVSFPTSAAWITLSRTWTRTPGPCCQSFLASTASSVGARTSELLWWTTFYHALCACTSSLIWRAPHTRGEHPRRKGRSPNPLLKTWTFWVMFLRASLWTRTHTALWSKLCRETVWWEREEGGDGWTVVCRCRLTLYLLFYLIKAAQPATYKLFDYLLRSVL